MQELEVLMDKETIHGAIQFFTDIRTGKDDLEIREPEIFSQQPSNDAGQQNLYPGFFQPIECFKRIGIVDGYNPIYCTGNSTILFLSTVNTLVVTILLIYHLKLKGAHNFRTYIKVKSSILILMLLFELSVFWRYFYNFDFDHDWEIVSYRIMLIGSNSI